MILLSAVGKSCLLHAALQPLLSPAGMGPGPGTPPTRSHRAVAAPAELVTLCRMSFPFQTRCLFLCSAEAHTSHGTRPTPLPSLCPAGRGQGPSFCSTRGMCAGQLSCIVHWEGPLAMGNQCSLLTLISPSLLHVSVRFRCVFLADADPRMQWAAVLPILPLVTGNKCHLPDKHTLGKAALNTVSTVSLPYNTNMTDFRRSAWTGRDRNENKTGEAPAWSREAMPWSHSTWNTKKNSSIPRNRVEWWLPGAGGWGNQERPVTGHKLSIIRQIRYKNLMH